MPDAGMKIYKKGYDSEYERMYAAGFAAGYTTAIISMLDDGLISVEYAAEKLNKTLDEVQELLNEYIANKAS